VVLSDGECVEPKLLGIDRLLDDVANDLPCALRLALVIDIHVAKGV
jgi:hypothetical protein